jgi:nucleobase:cation symporter-1, NCS1 family
MTILGVATAVLLWMRHTAGSEAAPIYTSHFTSAAFMLAATQAAAWSLSYGPYVADYSRYLPPTIPAVKTFWYTAMGCFFWTGSAVNPGARGELGSYKAMC